MSAVGSGTIILVNTVSDNTTDDTVCSLREAITNADANGAIYDDCGGGSGDDLIIFDNALGTAAITLGSYLPNITDTSGLTINGGGDISISGNDLYRVFNINSGVPLILNNLTVTAGNPIGSGGGISNTGTLTVTKSTFSGNSANSGGGIGNDGTLTVTNSTFLGNIADSTGGGVYNASTRTLNQYNVIIANSTGETA